MPKKTSRPPLDLTVEDLAQLQAIANSRTRPKREVDRAQILILYHQKMEFTAISNRTSVSVNTIMKNIDKALSMGWEAGLRDLPHSPGNAVITLEAKAWVIDLACTKPKDLGMAAEIWTRSALAKYVREHATEAGFPCLSKAAKATVHRILGEHHLKPHKIKYYLEKQDPEFEEKMKEVLVVYREVELLRESGNERKIVTVCVDEKPGVQAIENKAKDLPPRPGKNPQIARDPEYIRHGTASIIAGLDLHDGHVFAKVERRHRSKEFISLLEDMHQYYPKDVKIRIILDNHSCHVSKETRAYLKQLPGRFEYVHTPKHGSWLNLAETLFGKMARTFLRQIRVSSWEELRDRILLGVQEINDRPVVHKWTKFEALNI